MSHVLVPAAKSMVKRDIYATASDAFKDGLCLALYSIDNDLVYLRCGDEEFKLTVTQSWTLPRSQILIQGYGAFTTFKVEDVRASK